MLKSVVYEGNSLLGEVEIYPMKLTMYMEMLKEIRISYFSQPSERCSPLSVLHTIANPSALCFKLESQSNEQLFSLHSICLRDNKTAVVLIHDEEIHLVAMPSRRNVAHHACFWGFAVAPGLYKSCLSMLNLRCLGIVFDLDETLVVANTIRSIDDRVDIVQRKIENEMDPQRISGMLAEIKRYQDDKVILKQYIESDQIVENGKVLKVQLEVVPALSEDHEPIVRPIIRLREKNIILTRINPLNRDTSVLVRLRPSWEDLRSYLTARGRKRFEVYVCTMAEKDYALEMWRLLDPESNLISSKELLERIVCVKAGSKKSLLNVFHDGICHPKMALVIDDRLKVWDEKDQPRVHVVPAFAPYYAPQAEANNVIPVLCVARNVACNVRGGFFKDFDDGLLQKMSEVFYEDDFAEFPSAPDVSNYLISEDEVGGSSKDPLGLGSKADIEVDKRLKDKISSSSMLSTQDLRQAISIQPAVASIFSTLLQPTLQTIPAQTNPFPLAVPSVKPPLVNIGPVEPTLQGSPAREEGEVPESELDPDTRRRLLILQHGQDTREQTSSEPPFPVRPPLQVSVPQGNPHGMWPPMEEKMSSRQQNQVVPKPIPKDIPLASDTKHYDKHVNRRPPFLRGVESSISTDRYHHENQRSVREVHRRDDRLRPNHSFPKRRPLPVFKDDEMQMDPPMSKNEEHPVDALRRIARKCRTTVEFKSSLVSSIELKFSIEVWFNGEKISDGIARTRKEAQHIAAEQALRHLSSRYLSNDFTSAHGDINKLLDTKENGFRGDSRSPGYQTTSKEGLESISSKLEPPRFVDPRLEDPKRLTSSVSELKELCLAEGFSLEFQDHSPLPVDPNLEGEFHAKVQIGGQMLGNGIGSTWEEARMRASEEALERVKSMIGPGAQNNQTLPRSPVASSKRQKVDFTPVLQRIPSSLKYSNNTSPVS